MDTSNRRDVLRAAVAVGGVALTLGGTAARAALPVPSSPQVQPALRYAPDALAPAISARTVDFHYNKHHKGYFTNLAKLVAGTPMASASLEQIILATAGKPESRGIFNNAAQALNHNLYWQSLTPGGTAPSAGLMAAITRDFGTRAALEAELAKAATSQFGSGWAWLALSGSSASGATLKVVATSNADTPLTMGMTPLLVVDVWEHAYYLDEQNRRADYVTMVLPLLDWAGASARSGM
jgi:Fe-Mn family superoxide dismutase